MALLTSWKGKKEVSTCKSRIKCSNFERCPLSPKSDALSKCRLVKFREVSDSVWVSFESCDYREDIKRGLDE